MTRDTVVALAPAKLNLTLEVFGPRDDGYHPLRSVMVPIGWYDRLEFRAAEHRSLAAPAEIVRGNLVEAALDAAGVPGAFAVTIEKRIPIGAGLGGGSSDAAATLRLAMEGALGPCGERDWLALARGLGSDVPFFLAGTGALVEGTGERVTPLGRMPPWWAVVVAPPLHTPTAAAYRRLDERRLERPAPSRPRSESRSLAAVDALQRADFAALAAAITNDFHDLAIANDPPVAAAAAALREAGAARALLSGSGSSVFAIEPDAARAHALAERVAGAGEVVAAPFVHGTAWR